MDIPGYTITDEVYTYDLSANWVQRKSMPMKLRGIGETIPFTSMSQCFTNFRNNCSQHNNGDDLRRRVLSVKRHYWRHGQLLPLHDHY